MLKPESFLRMIREMEEKNQRRKEELEAQVINLTCLFFLDTSHPETLPAGPKVTQRQTFFLALNVSGFGRHCLPSRRRKPRPERRRN
jgi:hypothetical protein